MKTLASLSSAQMPQVGWKLGAVRELCGPVSKNPTIVSLKDNLAFERQQSKADLAHRPSVSMQLKDDAQDRVTPHSFPTGWDFWHQLGSPKTVCAPMVDQSECTFRMLCREFGTELAYTPMIHARLFMELPIFREMHFDPHPSDRPLIAQLAGHDPDVVLAAAKHIQASGLVDAIDLNFGCPQHIASKGRYGAFLLEEPEVVIALVRRLASELKIPVTAKVRLLPSLSETIDLCKRIEDAGASVLTVHGRTRTQNKQLCGSADWDAIRDVAQALGIPVIANGGVETWKDVEACLNYTGCAAVMSSEALLENPALFCSNINPTTGKYLNQTALTLRYLELCAQYPPSKGLSMVRGHLFKLLHNGLQNHTLLREELLVASSLDEVRDIVKRLDAIGWDMPNFHHADPGMEQLERSWYRRYRKAEKPTLSPEEKLQKKLEKKRKKALRKKEFYSLRSQRKAERRKLRQENKMMLEAEAAMKSTVL